MRFTLILAFAMALAPLCADFSPARAGSGFTIVPTEQPTIQAAIDAAVDGELVVVEPGTYFENLDFLGKQIEVRSTEGPDVTFIDGTFLTLGPGLGSVVRFASGETEESILSGFTLLNGSGTLVSGETRGGGIYCENTNPTLSDLRFVGNLADLGGGVGCFGLPSPRLESCRFEDNQATSGGGLYADNCGPIIGSSIFVGNVADSGGGIQCFFLSNAILTNVTLVDNVATQGGAAYCELFSDVAFHNCILWDNSATASPNVFSNGSTPALFHCNVEGGWPGAGSDNTDQDPQFVDPLIGNYRLSLTSPLLDAGDNGAPFMTPTDLDGLPRIECGTVDLGSFESPPPPGGCPTPFQRGDCNVDGTISLADALRLLGHTTLGDPIDCATACDSNGDNSLDVADAVFTVSAIFVPGSPTFPNPFPACGVETSGVLDCVEFSACP